MERPCTVYGTKAICHGFFSRSRVVSPSPMVGGAPGGTIAYPVAVVERLNGKTELVDVGDVHFTDTEDHMNTLFSKEE